MTPSARDRDSQPSTRDRILDAAAQVMRGGGLVRATTKEIARVAGCSEALLYKYFPDKRDLFLCVLTERSARLDIGTGMVGTATVAENLATITDRLLEFYAANFPMAASIFGNTDLLAAHREAMNERRAGPQAPSAMVARYLEAEAQGGRIGDADPWAVARLLTGAALHEAFLASYEGRDIDERRGVARRLVAALRLA